MELNTQYLKQHPEIKFLITAFISEVIYSQPSNIKEFAKLFFAMPDVYAFVSNLCGFACPEDHIKAVVTEQLNQMLRNKKIDVLNPNYNNLSKTNNNEGHSTKDINSRRDSAIMNIKSDDSVSNQTPMQLQTPNYFHNNGQHVKYGSKSNISYQNNEDQNQDSNINSIQQINKQMSNNTTFNDSNRSLKILNLNDNSQSHIKVDMNIDEQNINSAVQYNKQKANEQHNQMSEIINKYKEQKKQSEIMKLYQNDDQSENENNETQKIVNDDLTAGNIKQQEEDAIQQIQKQLSQLAEFGRQGVNIKQLLDIGLSFVFLPTLHEMMCSYQKFAVSNVVNSFLIRSLKIMRGDGYVNIKYKQFFHPDILGVSTREYVYGIQRIVEEIPGAALIFTNISIHSRQSIFTPSKLTSCPSCKTIKFVTGRFNTTLYQNVYRYLPVIIKGNYLNQQIQYFCVIFVSFVPIKYTEDIIYQLQEKEKNFQIFNDEFLLQQQLQEYNYKMKKQEEQLEESYINALTKINQQLENNQITYEKALIQKTNLVNQKQQESQKIVDQLNNNQMAKLPNQPKFRSLRHDNYFFDETEGNLLELDPIDMLDKLFKEQQEQEKQTNKQYKRPASQFKQSNQKPQENQQIQNLDEIKEMLKQLDNQLSTPKISQNIKSETMQMLKEIDENTMDTQKACFYENIKKENIFVCNLSSQHPVNYRNQPNVVQQPEIVNFENQEIKRNDSLQSEKLNFTQNKNIFNLKSQQQVYDNIQAYYDVKHIIQANEESPSSVDKLDHIKFKNTQIIQFNPVYFKNLKCWNNKAFQQQYDDVYLTVQSFKNMQFQKNFFGKLELQKIYITQQQIIQQHYIDPLMYLLYSFQNNNEQSDFQNQEQILNKSLIKTNQQQNDLFTGSYFQQLNEVVINKTHDQNNIQQYLIQQLKQKLLFKHQNYTQNTIMILSYKTLFYNSLLQKTQNDQFKLQSSQNGFQNLVYVKAINDSNVNQVFPGWFSEEEAQLVEIKVSLENVNDSLKKIDQLYITEKEIINQRGQLLFQPIISDFLFFEGSLRNSNIYQQKVLEQFKQIKVGEMKISDLQNNYQILNNRKLLVQMLNQAILSENEAKKEVTVVMDRYLLDSPFGYYLKLMNENLQIKFLDEKVGDLLKLGKAEIKLLYLGLPVFQSGREQ